MLNWLSEMRGQTTLTPGGRACQRRLSSARQAGLSERNSRSDAGRGLRSKSLWRSQTLLEVIEV